LLSVYKFAVYFYPFNQLAQMWACEKAYRVALFSQDLVEDVTCGAFAVGPCYVYNRYIVLRVVQYSDLFSVFLEAELVGI
jgi:hypothetical protein